MFYNNLATICEQNNTNVPTLIKDLSIPRPTMYSWKRNGSTPRPAVVSKIADYLKVEPEKLTEENKNTTTPKRPRINENQITSVFNSLNAQGKRTLIERAKELSQIKKYAK